MATQLPPLNNAQKRKIPPPKALADAISEAIDRSYGLGYSFRVRQGLVDEEPGASPASKSGRHVLTGPGAADIQIYDPTGRQLRGADLVPLAKNWGSATMAA
jgi:hypothetical protein